LDRSEAGNLGAPSGKRTKTTWAPLAPEQELPKEKLVFNEFLEGNAENTEGGVG
jgi:hypothetical protein